MKTAFKKIFLLMAVVMTAMVCLAFSASAEKWEDYEYVVLDDETVEITDYTGDATELVIPLLVNEKQVASIGDSAFYSCNSLKSVVIPDGVTNIGDSAFYWCKNITSVTIPKSVMEIGDSAFSDCYKLAGITIPEGVTSIGDHTFRLCKNLTSIVIPSSITRIGYDAFGSCSSLTSVKIGSGVTSIGAEAFYYCTSLVSVTIPSGVASIGYDAFNSDVVIYCNKDSLGASWAAENGNPYVLIDGGDEVNIFSGKVGKINWTIDKRTGILELDGSGELPSFANTGTPWKDYNVYVEKIVFSEGFTGIGDGFSSYPRLTDVVIPEGVTHINTDAFLDCNSLKEINLPKSLTDIGDCAFSDCDSLKQIIIPDGVYNIGYWTFSSCENLETVILPDSVVIIGNGVFVNCPKLKKITIPYRVKNLYTNTFDSALEEFIIFSENCEFEADCGLTYATKIYGFKGSTVEAFAEEIYADFFDVETIHNHEYKTVSDLGCCPFVRCFCGKEKGRKEHIDTDSNAVCDNCKNSANDISVGVPLSVKLEEFEETYFGFTATKTGKYTVKVSDNYLGSISIFDETKSKRLDATNDNTPLDRNLKAGEKVYFSVFLYDRTIITLSLTYEELPPCSHSYNYYDTERATCTSDGFTTYRCYSCGDTYTETIPAKGHEYTVMKTQSATCTVDGFVKYYCFFCDHSYIKTTPATGKHSTVTDKAVAATCTKTGLTQGSHCSVCNTVIKKQETVAKKAHTYKINITKATLAKNGKTETKCTVCGYISKTTVIYAPKTVKLSAVSYAYNGKAKTPSVTVKDYKGNTLKKDTDYTVSYESGRTYPGEYTVKITFKGKYEGTKKLYFTIAPKATSKITATQTTTTITLKWSKVTGADGYRVYKYNSKTKKYEKLKDVTGTSLKISKLSAGTAYKYKVRAYTKDDGTIWGAYSSVFETATKPATPKITKLSTTKGKASFTWSNVSGESGYQVYYSTKKDSGYKKVASYKTNVVKGSKSKLTSGKTYYFKVRAYKKTASGTVYSAWSPIKSLKVK